MPGAAQTPPSPSPGGLQDDPLTERTDDVDDERSDEEESSTEENTTEDAAETPGSGKPEDIKIPEALVPELAEVQTIELPILGVEVPVPRTEILVTATSTAAISSVAAVGGTLFATTLFRRLQPILKPIFKTILKKLAKIRKKPPPKTWARQRLSESRRRRSDRKEIGGGS